ncbi:endonuclease/exonuclease/phosphatase family protein [Streptomyces sp. NPDC054796]
MTTVTMMGWNIEKGVNWRAAVAFIREIGPDIHFQQEVQPGQLQEQADLLNMDGYPATPTSRISTNNNAIFLSKTGPFACAETYDHPWAPWKAPANIAVRLRAKDGTLSPRQLSLVCGHACYWSSDIRMIEAQWCSTLAKPGWLALHFWDWNSYRAGEGGDWQDYTDHAYVANRTYQDNGTRHSDDRPDREMLAAGYIELARHASEHLGQPEAMNPTAGYRTHHGRPPGLYCIDRTYMSGELAPALTHYEVVDTPHLRRLSDHLPTIATYDLDTFHAILHRPTRLYTPTHTTPARAV